jgi:hypothetical protein
VEKHALMDQLHRTGNHRELIDVLLERVRPAPCYQILGRDSRSQLGVAPGHVE